MTITYEWDMETVDEHGAVQDHHHAGKVADLPHWTDQKTQALVLVRDDDNPDTPQPRLWAYVDFESMRLPEFFEGAGVETAVRVPARFHVELGKAVAAGNI